METPELTASDIKALETTAPIAAPDEGYAKSALHAAGKRMRDWRRELDRAHSAAAGHVAEKPGRSVLLAALTGAALMTLALGALGTARR